ncbi:NADP-dependent oxidoreductase domain-containing protein [Tricharina praecox]|uniref:NADP-dependent oxidoreductase domain-containing protein n=1 Tax=Tricharina praecox TaxID=43433 RepID=UPI0022207A52|nr:NADP-dependent oxidoreductase domain-containing protein [Tricharina praecox]KAI5853745.1 NADP-dependent oxidoreductase domain-containing protein [Tricharina praecox]
MDHILPNPASRRPLSKALPPIVLGTATFNHQYNSDPHSLATTAIVHKALRYGIRAFDTSPYYGPAETLLGEALNSQSFVPRSDYILQSKCGRIRADEFDYSPEWIRQSIQNSLQRLGTEYLDVVFCHDVEFVKPHEVITAVRTLRELRDQGLIRYVGISGYPTDVLASLAKEVKELTGEPLDAVMSYAHYTLQNTVLFSKALGKLVDAGVDCVLNGSPLGMGLLRRQGVPVGGMGDFHPAPKALRNRCIEASDVVEKYGQEGERLETLALRFSIEGWMKDGAVAGTTVKPLLGDPAASSSPRTVQVARPRLGVTVAGVSYMNEMDELAAIWRDVITASEREFLYQKVIGAFGDEWKDYSWPSPGEGYVRSSGHEEPEDESLLKSRL